MTVQKKAIYGGTFDPVHNGHIYLAERALEFLSLDKVIFVPAGSPPLKTKKIVTDGKIRLDMIKKATASNVKFETSSFEIDNNDISYTYKTIQYFKELEKETKWYFLVGTDCLYEFHLWKNVNIILDSCQVVVFNRPGFQQEEILIKKAEVERKYNHEILFLDVMDVDISSSNIRERAKSGENLSHLLAKPVVEIIEKYKLYR